MSVIDILGFCLSLLGIYGPILFVLYLLPRNVTPCLSTLLEETRRLLRRVEEVGAVPLHSKYKHHLNHSANQFAMMRLESNHAQGIFNQLRVALLGGLTYKMYSLYYEIEAIKSGLEVETDKQQLNSVRIVASAELPIPVDATATPVNNHINGSKLTLPLPATMA